MGPPTPPLAGKLPTQPWGGDRDMGFPSGRYLPSASLPLRAALRGRGLVLLRADLFAKCKIKVPSVP